MCGGWACASYDLACNNPPLSTIRFTGRDFIPTPCGPNDNCYAKDTSRKNSNNCYVPHTLAPLESQICTGGATLNKAQEKTGK
ncbi:hypothetical protein KR059_008468 [Drosophila kikkawai]|nr:hypothetical protein KR059_008468 [Drosophila kikkawai]